MDSANLTAKEIAVGVGSAALAGITVVWAVSNMDPETAVSIARFDRDVVNVTAFLACTVAIAVSYFLRRRTFSRSTDLRPWKDAFSASRPSAKVSWLLFIVANLILAAWTLDATFEGFARLIGH